MGVTAVDNFISCIYSEEHPESCEEKCQVEVDCYVKSFGEVCKAEYFDAKNCTFEAHDEKCTCTVVSHDESFTLDLTHAAKKLRA